MKKLRFFDSLKLVLATVACMFILNVAHADTNAIQSVIAYGKTEQSGTPTPTNPVPIMTNNGVLKVRPNLFDGLVIGGISVEGALVSTAQRLRTNYIDIEGQRRYTYSTNLDELVGGVHAIIAFYDSNKVTLQRTANNPVDGTVLSPATARYMAVAYYNSAETVSEYQSRVKFRLFQGTSADEVYADGLTETIRDSAGHTATAQMLLSVGDYKDEQEILSGTVTRKVGVKVLDGTENWQWAGTSVWRVRVPIESIATEQSLTPALLSTHFNAHSWNSPSAVTPSVTLASDGSQVDFNIGWSNNITDLSTWKQWLADQYANGTPVIVVYPLAESAQTPESVTPQSLTTAPVRQTAGSILGMPIEVVLGDGTREWVSEIITIATTKYNEQQFAPVQTDLSAAMNAVDDVVTRTMSQAQAIDTIATTKQTRPAESCPPFKKCLLVEGEDGTPHWYEIYDPINDFLNPILAAAGLSGNQGAPVQTIHACGSNSTCYDKYNGFYMGNGDFRQKYIDNLDSTYERPFGPTTLARCSVPVGEHTNTDTREAGLCYNTGGMFRTLTEGSDDDSGGWALVWNGNDEDGASLGITPGVVYGVAKCTSVGKHMTEITGDVPSGSEYWWPEKLNNYATSNPTTLASLITEYPNSNIETVFNTLPSEYGTDEKPGYPRDNFMNCWCKMTAIGVPGAGGTPDQRYANGTIMSVSGGWVFANTTSVAAGCASGCARNCTIYVQARAVFRRAVLTVK